MAKKVLKQGEVELRSPIRLKSIKKGKATTHLRRVAKDTYPAKLVRGTNGNPNELWVVISLGGAEVGLPKEDLEANRKVTLKDLEEFPQQKTA